MNDYITTGIQVAAALALVPVIDWGFKSIVKSAGKLPAPLRKLLLLKLG